jgi:hypothetical protein
MKSKKETRNTAAVTGCGVETEPFTMTEKKGWAK